MVWRKRLLPIISACLTTALNRNAPIWSAELQRLSASGERERYLSVVSVK